LKTGGFQDRDRLARTLLTATSARPQSCCRRAGRN